MSAEFDDDFLADAIAPTLPVTIYHRPDGRREQIDCRHVYPDDAEWFKANSVKVSMEEDGAGGFVLYGDTGLTDEDDEPIEMIVLSGGRTCQESLKALREECAEFKAAP